MKTPVTTLSTAVLLAMLGGSAAAQPAPAAAGYDYIVAGGGPAGIVAAEHLSRSGRKVLLLEKGGPVFYALGATNTTAWNNTVTMYDVPGLIDSNYANPDFEFCTDVSVGAGCNLGGGTTVNAMMFVRPRAADFAGWPESWQWNRKNGIAKSAEDVYKLQPGTILASKDGMRYDDAAFSVVSGFLKANGFSETDALHNPEAKDFVYSHPAWSIAHGLRDSPARAILTAAKSRANFELELNTNVVRAVRDGNKVTGVEVERANGAREVISLSPEGSLLVAAGAHSTPRVLFNSGIGPAAQIEIVAAGNTSVELPPKEQWIDLPVGENLKDHAVVTITLTTNGTELVTLPKTAWTQPSEETVDLFAQGSGLLTQSSQRINFWFSANTTSSSQFYYQGTVKASKDNTIQVKLYLTHGTQSTGVVEITPGGSTNMTVNPLLRLDSDKEAMALGINTILEYARLPGSSLVVPANLTAEALMAPGKVASGAHHTGTTRMGNLDDGSSVVDEDAKVWGVENLFVVDASIHPEVPTGNTQAPVMVVAAHAARRILALHGYGGQC